MRDKIWNLMFLAIVFATGCSNETFEAPTTSGSIETSLFGASFNRVFYQSPNDSLPDVEDSIAFPTSGVPQSFEALKTTSSIRNADGIRKGICEIKHLPFFLNFDEDQFFAGYTLGFEMNISTISDVTDTIPFARETLEAFLKVGKTYSVSPDVVGSIQMYFIESGEGDMGLLNKHFLTGELGGFPALNTVTVTGIEEHESIESDGTVIGEGFRVSVAFRFSGSVRFPFAQYDYFFCDLLDGKADFFIAHSG